MVKLLHRQKQFIYFLIAGSICASFEIVLFKVLSISVPRIFPQENSFYGIHYPLSNILSTVLAILLNYFLSIRFVFEQGKHSRKREFTYFMVVSVLTMFGSLLLFQVIYGKVIDDIAVVNLGFYSFSSEVLSKIGAIVAMAFINYGIKKKLVFNG